MNSEIREYLEFRNASIRRYYPDVLANAKEFKAIADVVELELNEILQLILKNTFNLFVFELDIKGCERWEKMLAIYPLANATVEDRRMVILSKMLSSLPYTHRKLMQILNGVCGDDGYKIVDDYKNYRLKILLNLGVKNQFNVVKNLVRYIIPANLTLIVDLLYNRHIDLEVYTHEYLSNLTHDGIESEVIN